MILVQSAEAVEYTNCLPAEGQDPLPQRVYCYDIKPSDSKAPVPELWGMQCTTSSFAIALRSNLTRKGNTYGSNRTV